jgi:hypothetical protein
VQHHTNSEQSVGKGGVGGTAGKANPTPKAPTVEQLTHEYDVVAWQVRSHVEQGPAECHRQYLEVTRPGN